MAGKKYKTLSEKWAAEDAAAAAKKKASTPAKKAPAKKESQSIFDFMRSKKSERERAIKEATSSRKSDKSSRRYT